MFMDNVVIGKKYLGLFYKEQNQIVEILYKGTYVTLAKILQTGAEVGIPPDCLIELSEPKKKKVKLYKYAYKDFFNTMWKDSLNYYSSDEKFTDVVVSAKFLRIEQSMIEVDEE